MSKQATRCLVTLSVVATTTAFEINNTAFGKVGTHKATMYVTLSIFIWNALFNLFLWKGYANTKEDYSYLYEKELLNSMWTTYTLLNPVFLGIITFVLTTTVDQSTAIAVMLTLITIGGSNGVLWGTVVSKTTIFGQLAKTGSIIAAGLAAIGKEHVAPHESLLINCSLLLLMYLLVEGIVLIQIIFVYNQRVRLFDKAKRETVWRAFRKMHGLDINLSNAIKTIDYLIKKVNPMNQRADIDWEKESGSALKAIQCYTDTNCKFLQIPLAQQCLWLNQLYATMMFINGVLCICAGSTLSGELLVATILTALSSVLIMVMQCYSGPDLTIKMHPPMLPTNYNMQKIFCTISELTPKESWDCGKFDSVLKKCLEKMLSAALGGKKQGDTWHINGSFMLKETNEDVLQYIRLFMPVLDNRSSRANADRAELLTAWTLLFIGIAATTNTKSTDVMRHIRYTIVDDDGLVPKRSTFGYLHPDESYEKMGPD